uniref:ARAD1C04048p n=1 Tax=Blastobotrys adeninivorans TaxID=409370 RepID=A0A060SZC6_BLAAD
MKLITSVIALAASRSLASPIIVSRDDSSSQLSCQTVKDAVSHFQDKYYNASAGTWQGGNPGPSTWNNANVLTTIADFMQISPEAFAQYSDTVQQVFKGTQLINLNNTNSKKEAQDVQSDPNRAEPDGFTDNFYDDNGWWAMGWISAYDATHKGQYLQAATEIFDNMTGAWDDKVCGGGIWWTTDKNYKNAIANELFMNVAASLANRVSANRQHYFNWARKAEDWFFHSGMLNSDSLINDGLDNNCKNNGGTVWTYNQGVILGALIELDKLDPGNHTRIDRATTIADAALKHMTQNGILSDPCPDSSGDCAGAGTFKGVFVRNLRKLYDTTQNKAYSEMLVNNANSMLSKDRRDDGDFGFKWEGPPGDATVMTMGSALDLLVSGYSVTGCH